MSEISLPRVPFDIVGFDLDGTLLDTVEDLAAAVNHALALARRPLLSIDQVKPLIGAGAKNTLIHALEQSGGLPEEEFRPLHKELLKFYAANGAVHTRPFPGALEAVDALRAQGVKVGIVTNKFENMALGVLTELKLLNRFETVIGGDTLGTANAKPSAAPIHELIARCGGGRAVFVGDSSYDIMAARNASIPAVAVSFGYLLGPVDDLAADAVIDHYDDLIPTLMRFAR